MSKWEGLHKFLRLTLTNLPLMPTRFAIVH